MEDCHWTRGEKRGDPGGDKLLKQGTIIIKWTHVKGHSDNKGNIEADKLVVKGSNLGWTVPPSGHCAY